MNAEQYRAISAPFRNDAIAGLLPTADKALTATFYVLFPLLIALLVLNVEAPWPLNPATEVEGSAPFHPLLLPSVIVPGCGFLVVSLARKAVNAPRPYEALSISPIIVKETKGQSFPSKHVFSSFCIAMAWLAYCAPAGCVLLVLACCIALIRVIGGVHWPRDVVAGAIAGVACGIILMLW